MRRFRFYKEPDNRWFIDLPEWEGSKADLEMVAGADVMLDYMAEDKDEVFLYISEEPFEDSDVLEFQKKADEIGNGAYYLMPKYRGIDLNLELWLCDVTLHVFNGTFPSVIHVRKIEE